GTVATGLPGELPLVAVAATTGGGGVWHPAIARTPSIEATDERTKCDFRGLSFKIDPVRRTSMYRCRSCMTPPRVERARPAAIYPDDDPGDRRDSSDEACEKRGDLTR